MQSKTSKNALVVTGTPGLLSDLVLFPRRGWHLGPTKAMMRDFGWGGYDLGMTWGMTSPLKKHPTQNANQGVKQILHHGSRRALKYLGPWVPKGPQGGLRSARVRDMQAVRCVRDELPMRRVPDALTERPVSSMLAVRCARDALQ